MFFVIIFLKIITFFCNKFKKYKIDQYINLKIVLIIFICRKFFLINVIKAYLISTITNCL